MAVSALPSNCQGDPSLDLEVPKKGLSLVQKLPPQEREGAENPLYLPARAIEENEWATAKLQTLIDSMYAVMVAHAGVGIAANQIGKRLQIFIIEAQEENPRYRVLGPVPKQVFLNPRITAVSSQLRNFWHGCLSAQGEKRGNVATYTWLEYECRDIQGKVRQGRLEGFAAVIFQHEFRHLLGGTYLDHAQHLVDKETLEQKIAEGELPFFEPASDTLPLLLADYRIGESLEAYYQRKH